MIDFVVSFSEIKNKTNGTKHVPPAITIGITFFIMDDGCLIPV
ncbi:MAG: hypothetical protein ACI90V_004328 [Bacillariaceae sp.]|jgi:hypothetical protein